MARQKLLLEIGFEDIAALTDMEQKGVEQAKSRNEFDFNNLGSIVVWLARKGSNDLRRACFEYGSNLVQDNPWLDTPKRRAPKTK